MRTDNDNNNNNNNNKVDRNKVMRPRKKRLSFPFTRIQKENRIYACLTCVRIYD